MCVLYFKLVGRIFVLKEKGSKILNLNIWIKFFFLINEIVLLKKKIEWFGFFFGVEDIFWIVLLSDFCGLSSNLFCNNVLNIWYM